VETKVSSKDTKYDSLSVELPSGNISLIPPIPLIYFSCLEAKEVPNPSPLPILFSVLSLPSVCLGEDYPGFLGSPLHPLPFFSPCALLASPEVKYLPISLPLSHVESPTFGRSPSSKSPPLEGSTSYVFLPPSHLVLSKYSFSSGYSLRSKEKFMDVSSSKGASFVHSPPRPCQSNITFGEIPIESGERH
jgi:hypothetical protein